MYVSTYMHPSTSQESVSDFFLGPWSTGPGHWPLSKSLYIFSSWATSSSVAMKLQPLGRVSCIAVCICKHIGICSPMPLACLDHTLASAFPFNRTLPRSTLVNSQQLGHRRVPERVPPAFSAEPTVSAYPLGSMCPVEITNTRALLRENLWRKKEGSGRKQGEPTDRHVGRTFVRRSCIGKSDCRAVLSKSWWGQGNTQTAREESTSDRKAPALTPPPRSQRVGAALGDASSCEVRGHTGHLFLQCEVWDVIVESGWGMFNPFMVQRGIFMPENIHMGWEHYGPVVRRAISHFLIILLLLLLSHFSCVWLSATP